MSDGSRYVQVVKPYSRDSFDWPTNKAMARNRILGNWLDASDGPVDDVEVVSIDERADRRGEVEATITYRLRV